MFSVKQVTDCWEMIWPDIDIVTAHGECGVSSVSAKGKMIDLSFDISSKRNEIYVMNENGSTVSKYNLGYRNVPETAKQPVQ